MLYAIGFIGLFTIGGLTGLFLASLGMDVHLTDTYFVIAHFHYVMVGGAIMGFLGGIHFWWPKMFGQDVSRGLVEGFRDHHFRRIQSDIFPAVPAGLYGDAAALPRLSA